MVSTHLKHISQIASFPQVEVENKRYVKPPPRLWENGIVSLQIFGIPITLLPKFPTRTTFPKRQLSPGLESVAISLCYVLTCQERDSSKWERARLYGITSNLFTHNILFQSKKKMIFQSDLRLAKLLEKASCVGNIWWYKVFSLERVK